MPANGSYQLVPGLGHDLVAAEVCGHLAVISRG
jgi:hypothetical protein